VEHSLIPEKLIIDVNQLMRFVNDCQAPALLRYVHDSCAGAGFNLTTSFHLATGANAEAWVVKVCWQLKLPHHPIEVGFKLFSHLKVSDAKLELNVDLLVDFCKGWMLTLAQSQKLCLLIKRTDRDLLTLVKQKSTEVSDTEDVLEAGWVFK
jgi:hypothetical protein